MEQKLEDHLHYLRRCVEISKQSRAHGNTPFGALLIDKEGNVLLEQENIEITESDCTGHAETSLMARASKRYDKSFLKECTLYSTFELCAMCAGAVYWGNVGRVVYALPESRLLQCTGGDEQNPTFDLPMREVFSRGQKQIEVIGPFLELEDEVLEAHKDYWNA